MTGRPLATRLADHGRRLAIVDPAGSWTYAVLDHEAAVLAEIVGGGRVDMAEGRVAILAEPGGMLLRLPALDVPAVGAVGAGDSFLAAMVFALSRGESPREAFALGMAAGAAAVMRPGTAHPRAEDVEALRRRIGPI